LHGPEAAAAAEGTFFGGVGGKVVGGTLAKTGVSPAIAGAITRVASEATGTVVTEKSSPKQPNVPNH
jgi:hypothetical protein